MYKEDCKKIAKFALKNPDNLVRVATFVLTTIQAGLATTHQQMLDIDKHGADSKYLWNKRNTNIQKQKIVYENNK